MFQEINLLFIISEAIFNSLQNTMIRTIFGFDKKKHVNMEHVRKEKRMMSINQMSVYHTLLEAYNVIQNSSSESIKLKWAKKNENSYFLRSETKFDQMIPEKPMKKCAGFSYNGSKLFNKLPCSIKEINNSKVSKLKSKLGYGRTFQHIKCIHYTI